MKALFKSTLAQISSTKYLKAGLAVAALVVGLTVQPSIGVVRGAVQAPSDCVDVPAPSPEKFEANIGKRFTIMATYQWFEISDGEWQLMIDIDPRGGHEIWRATYPTKWLFQKPVDLPQSAKEIVCPPEEEPEVPVEPEPSPTPEPEPTPTPNPDSGKRTSLGTDKVEVCELTEFEVVMDIKENGEGKKDVEVTFTYNGATKKAKTDKDGRARTSFARNGAGSVKAEADGWDSQSQYLEMPVCEPVALDPDRAIGGSVLGVSTLGETGSTASIFTTLLTMVGGVMTTAGVALAKKNK